MKKIILCLGVGLFLSVFALHVKVSTDSPLQLVTEEALAYGTFITDCSSVTNCEQNKVTKTEGTVVTCCGKPSNSSTGNKELN